MQQKAKQSLAEMPVSTDAAWDLPQLDAKNWIS